MDDIEHPVKRVDPYDFIPWQKRLAEAIGPLFRLVLGIILTAVLVGAAIGLLIVGLKAFLSVF